jgi:hypothetical protein
VRRLTSVDAQFIAAEDGRVHGHRLTAPGDDAALCELVAGIVATPLDLHRPPWALQVIEGLAGGRSAVVTKVHHSAFDGSGPAELFAIMHDPTPAAACSLARTRTGRARRRQRIATTVPLSTQPCTGGTVCTIVNV